jgi:hypothetical protein
MKFGTRAIVLTAVVFAVSFSLFAQKKAEVVKPAATKTEITKTETTTVEKPVIKLSDIPGITTPDRTPHACVDCHANHPEMKMDFRLTKVLASWKDSVPAEILKKAQAIAPEGRKLNGKHPDIKDLVKVIPNDCFMCHVRDSKVAPPFTKLLHAIHLEDGEKNHFLTRANGTCTSCHKLDQKTGTMGLGSGEEKQ